MSENSSKTTREAAFDTEALPDKIGKSLRSLYDEVLAEDVPDDFLNLLKQADKTGASDQGASK